MASQWLPFRLRYGHAFPSLKSSEDAVEILLRLVQSGAPIGARDPTDVSAVSAAEHALGLSGFVRPVYAYVGDLHPDLGRVGLIIAGRWYRRGPLGVSRCDTGGLIGLKGAFSCLGTASNAQAALERLTHLGTLWGVSFRMEIFRCYGKLIGWRSYLRGHPPTKPLNDDRDSFIRGMGTPGDRRLWTWEARSASPIEKRDVIAVALSPEAVKDVLADYRMNPLAYGGIELIPGVASSSGVHYFDEDNVVRAFMGLRSA